MLFFSGIQAKQGGGGNKGNRRYLIIGSRIDPGLYREGFTAWVGYSDRNIALVAVEYYAGAVDGQRAVAVGEPNDNNPQQHAGQCTV